VGGADLGDLLAFGEVVRERLDPGPAKTVELLAAIPEDV
jgi:hypothetical protein